MSISLSNDNYKSYICIQSGVQTHLMNHTKKEQRARPRNPLFVQNTKKNKKNDRNYKIIPFILVVNYIIWSVNIKIKVWYSLISN